ncbi:MAG: hypothetical protein R3Y21_05265 [Mycoplasmatota bacterium]
MTDKFNNMMNDIFESDPKVEITYEKLRYKKNCLYSQKVEPKKNIINDQYENILLEVKSQFHELFKKYLPLQLDFKESPPISLNVYKSNFNIKCRDEEYYSRLNILHDFEAVEVEDFSVYIKNLSNRKKFQKVKMWFNILINYERVDNSNNMIFYLEDQKLLLTCTSNMIINYLISTLSFYMITDMQKDLTKEKAILYNCKINKMGKNCKQYSNFILTLRKYNMFFEGLHLYKKNNVNDYLIKGEKNIITLYEEKIIECKELKKDYECRLNINNIKSTSSLAKVSIIVAIISLLLTCLISYFKI